jgi:hypothetical protein
MDLLAHLYDNSSSGFKTQGDTCLHFPGEIASYEAENIAI